jgi:Domain of unknown function (DUF4389)
LPYQVMFEADFAERRNRGSTFFRWLLGIPLIIWATLWAIVVYLVALIAWFALLFTARYPEGLYDFVAGYLRFYGRVLAFLNVMTDEYPSFGGGAEPSYPVRVQVAPPLEKYGRWRVFLRGAIAILVLGAAYVGFATVLVVLAAAPAVQWVVVVNDGRARRSLHRLSWVSTAFSVRITAWWLLIAQDLPPFLSEWERSAGAPAAAPPVAPSQG